MEHNLFLIHSSKTKFKTSDMSAFCLFVGDGDLNVYAWLDHDGCDLLDDFG